MFCHTKAWWSMIRFGRMNCRIILENIYSIFIFCGRMKSVCNTQTWFCKGLFDYANIKLYTVHHCATRSSPYSHLQVTGCDWKSTRCRFQENVLHKHFSWKWQQLNKTTLGKTPSLTSRIITTCNQPLQSSIYTLCYSTIIVLLRRREVSNCWDRTRGILMWG